MLPPRSDVHVHLLPALLRPEDLAGGVAAVIDVLRASTTVIQALANGATAVLPCATIEEARAVAARFAPEPVLLGGERGGVRIEGFDLDNSPASYTAAVVGGRTIAFTTTNGTAALRCCEAADGIILAAFNNLSAAAAWLEHAGRRVHLVCAGTDGRLTAEDILCAGMLARRLTGGGAAADVDLPTELAIDFARRRGADPALLLRTLRESLGGRNLIELGFDADIAIAARVDSLAVVPQFDRRSGTLTTRPAAAGG